MASKGRDFHCAAERCLGNPEAIRRIGSDRAGKHHRGREWKRDGHDRLFKGHAQQQQENRTRPQHNGHDRRDTVPASPGQRLARVLKTQGRPVRKCVAYAFAGHGGQQ